jgi:hypothetical protein
MVFEGSEEFIGEAKESPITIFSLATGVDLVVDQRDVLFH